jgi:hypothetical protein
MRGALLNLVLVIVLLALIAGNWVLRANTARTNVEVLPDMAHSARDNAYAPNASFADGKTLQAPVQGTIARGYAARRIAGR